MSLPNLPSQPQIDPAGDYARAQSFAVLKANFENAGNMAVWATQALNAVNSDIQAALKNDTISPAMQDLLDLLSAVPALDFSQITSYVAPPAPTYTAIPTYTAPTMGTLLDIPAVHDITIPDAPDATVDYTNSSFTDSLLTALKSRLEADMAGVTAAEAAMFARHTGRVTSENSRAYTQITTQMSSGGWDMPSGALLAKQTELNTEGGKRLTDASADIMMTAVKESLQGAIQVVDLVSRVSDSKEMRDFEKAKADVQFAIEGFKATIEGILGTAQVDKTKVEAVTAANDGVIKSFLGEIEGQTAPMKAIADSNQAIASGYKAAVEGAGAAVSSSAIKEELKLKAISTEGEIAGKAAGLSVEAAKAELAMKIEAMRGVAQGLLQVIASSQNTLSTSTSFGWSAGASTGYDGDIATHSADKRYAVDHKVNPA